MFPSIAAPAAFKFFKFTSLCILYVVCCKANEVAKFIMRVKGSYKQCMHGTSHTHRHGLRFTLLLNAECALKQ